MPFSYKFPSPSHLLFGPRECYGLDLGNRYAKLVRARSTERGWTITGADVLDWSDASRTDANRTDANGTGESDITGILKSYKGEGAFLRRPPLACSLPNSWYKTFSIELPPATREERRQMLLNELRTDDDSAEEWTVDYLEAGWDEPPSGTVTAVAVRTGAIVRLESQIHAAGFDCRIIDCPLAAAARSVDLMSETNSFTNTEAVLDWGDTQATFILLRDRRFLYSRQLRRCGLELLIDDLAEAFALTKDAARQLLQRNGFATQAATAPESFDAEIKDVCRPTVERITAELTRTFKYLEEQGHSNLPERITLVGGGAALPGAEGVIANAATRPTRGWVAPTDPSLKTFHPPLFAAAAALSVLAGSA